MNINPTSPHGARSADPAAIEAQRAADPARSPDARTADAGSATPQGADSVEVSSEAKALADGSEARGKSQLSAERLKEIGERLATGYYDRPEVIDEVAKRIQADPNFRNHE